jgi:lipoate-protein ligase A
MEWRLLDTGPGAPAWNMALDEALLEEASERDARPTERGILRLYGWRPAALSLGRFQSLSELAGLPEEIPRVRRLTGGGAIHHREDELTYSIVAPYSAFGGRGSPKHAYQLVHEAIALGLESLGLALRGGASTPGTCGTTSCAPLCYDRVTDYDLKAGMKKLVGSAQRRKGATFLQHGSIPLSRDPFSRGAASLEELLGRLPARAEVARVIRAGFELAFGLAFVPGTPSPAELARARELDVSRYSSASWTKERL